MSSTKPQWKYFAVYADTGAKATPEGSKKTIEGFASFLSKEQGRNVCLKRYQVGAPAAPAVPGAGLAGSVAPSSAANPADTKVCYISGVRSKKR